MSVTEFFRALIASIRAEGTLDFACDDDAFEAGTRSAIEKAEELGVKVALPHRAFGVITEIGLDAAVRYGLLSNPNPRYERTSIQLPSKEAARDYLGHVAGLHRIGEFQQIAKSFLAAFRETYSERISA